MIQRDEHGNMFVQMADGAKVPLVDGGVNINITAVVDTTGHGSIIVPVAEALAIYRTGARYWQNLAYEREQTIADLHEQLARKE
jgi:hypothetical protein